VNISHALTEAVVAKPIIKIDKMLINMSKQSRCDCCQLWPAGQRWLQWWDWLDAGQITIMTSDHSTNRLHHLIMQGWDKRQCWLAGHKSTVDLII